MKELNILNMFMISEIKNVFYHFRVYFNIKDVLKYHKIINSVPLDCKNELKSEIIVGINNQNYFIDDILTSKAFNKILNFKRIQNKSNAVLIKPEKNRKRFPRYSLNIQTYLQQNIELYY